MVIHNLHQSYVTFFVIYGVDTVTLYSPSNQKQTEISEVDDNISKSRYKYHLQVLTGS